MNGAASSFDAIAKQKPNIMLKFLALPFLLLQAFNATGQATYAKTYEVPPLRIAYSDIQSALDKSRKIVDRVNGVDMQRSEIIEITSGPSKTTLSGWQINSPGVEIPPVADGFKYRYYTRTEGAPITSYSLDFDDYKRTINVEGQAAEQVEALHAVLRDELRKKSSLIGGGAYKFWLGFPAFWLASFTAWVFISQWRKNGEKRDLFIGFSSLWILIVLAILPTESILAGFSVRGDDPSFLNRNAGIIGFIGIIPMLLSVPAYFTRIFESKTSHKQD